MDKRVLKTRKCLKGALLELITEKPFEKISVKEICDRSGIGRVTFYNHYEDKFGLMEEWLKDMQMELQNRYNQLQEENNPQNQLEKTLMNMIDIVFYVDDHIPEERLRESPEMRNFYYHFVMKEMKQMESQLGIETRFDEKQLNAFLVMGSWGFLHGNGELSKEEVRANANHLIRDLISSNIFRKK